MKGKWFLSTTVLPEWQSTVTLHWSYRWLLFYRLGCKKTDGDLIRYVISVFWCVIYMYSLGFSAFTDNHLRLSRIFNKRTFHFYMTAFNCLRILVVFLARSWDRNVTSGASDALAIARRHTVRLSVGLTHACFVTKWKNILPIFRYHMKG